MMIPAKIEFLEMCIFDFDSTFALFLCYGFSSCVSCLVTSE
jgi:hypothetical protein